MASKRVWTQGEVTCFIAEWFGMDPQEIRGFVMMVLPVDQSHIGVPIQHNIGTPEAVIQLLSDVIRAPSKVMSDDEEW